jgi:hypothetical protein
MYAIGNICNAAGKIPHLQFVTGAKDHSQPSAGMVGFILVHRPGLR